MKWSMLRLAVWTLALLFLANAAGQLSSQLHAQAEPAAAKENAGEEQAKPVEPATSLGMMMVRSHWLSWVFYVGLFVFSIVAFMVALERAINLQRVKILPPAFVAKVQGLTARGFASEDELRSLSQTSDTAAGRILKAGVLRIGRPLPEVEKGMEDAAAREVAELRAKNRPLGVVGSVAPLVGLLGTVVGMIFAFGTASEVGLGKAEELAKGIYLALMTTAGGLSIAIPCLLLVAWFNGRVERYIREVDACLLETMPSFSRLESRQPAEEYASH